MTEPQREYYFHDAECTEKNFTPLNDRGLKTCLDCSGVFDEFGKGVATTDDRFDEHVNWETLEFPKYAKVGDTWHGVEIVDI